MRGLGARWAPTVTTVFVALALRGSIAVGQTSDLDETPLAMTLSELREELSRREADLRRYRSRLEELERENDEVRAGLEQREADLRRQEHTVRARLVTLCRMSRGGYVQLLGGASSWVDLIRRAQLVRAVTEQDIEALRAHQRAVEELESQREQLSANVESQRRLSDRISQYQQELEAERQRRLVAEPNPYPQTVPFDAPEPPMSTSGFGL